MMQYIDNIILPRVAFRKLRKVEGGGKYVNREVLRVLGLSAQQSRGVWGHAPPRNF